MPSSRHETIPLVARIIEDIRPRTMLDIGTGFGKWGFIAREALIDPNKPYDPMQPTIVGIEAHEPYIGAIQRAIYDRIIVGDARCVVPSMNETYDLITAIDVLEHMDLIDAKALIEECLKRSTYFIVGIPAYHIDQGAVFGNEFERHRCMITKRTLHGLGFRYVWYVSGSYIGLHTPRDMRRVMLLTTAYGAVAGIHFADLLLRRVLRWRARHLR